MTTKKQPAKQGGKPQTRALQIARAREVFLQALRDTCNVSEACREAGISRPTAYAWRENAAFAAAWADAEQEAIDSLEREAWRRGRDGVDKPVVHQGVITTTFKEYSDRMLEILLKAHRPEKYRERQDVKLSGDITIGLAERLASAIKNAGKP